VIPDYLKVPAMPLSTPAAREKMHTRTVTLEGFKRDDGLWDIEGCLTDVKTFDFPNAAKDRPAGTFHHEMYARLTIDADFNIRNAEVASDNHPYAGYCDAPVPDYRKLIGLNLKRGFRKKVMELMGRTRGCMHINELLGVMPTAAFQATARQLGAARADAAMDGFLGNCFALDRHGEAVKRYFPTWYIAPETGNDKSKDEGGGPGH
jgi:hypothetical protein